METLQDLYDMFFPILQDTEDGNAFFTVSQARNWANGAVLIIAEHAKHLDYSGTVAVVSGNSRIEIGSVLGGVWRVEIDNKAIRPISKKRLRESDRDWSIRTGQPTFYFLAEENADPDRYFIGLYPKSDASYTATVYCYAKPATFGAEDPATGRPQVPKWALPAVLWYMLANAYTADTIKQNHDLAAFYNRLFNDTLGRLQTRNASRLNKQWVVGSSGGRRKKYDLWDNLPDTIPEP